MKILFYHSTEFPQVQGRAAAKLFMPVADCLANMGHTVGIVAPRDCGAETLEMFAKAERVRHCVFTHLEPFLRSLPMTKPDLLVLFTDKPEQQRIAEKARGHGVKVLFSELGFLPHYNSIYFDEEGCGPASSLCRLIPKDGHTADIPKIHRDRGYVLVLLQLEEDYNFRASPFPSNSAFIAAVRHSFAGIPVKVRLHPAMGMEQPPLHEQLRECSCAVGLNTSALFECLKAGVPCYMLAEGPGRHSGAFLTDLKTTPFHANLECPEWHLRHRRARMLLAELLERRQIRLDRDVTPDILFGNAVLGAPLVAGVPADGEAEDDNGDNPCIAG